MCATKAGRRLSVLRENQKVSTINCELCNLTLVRENLKQEGGRGRNRWSDKINQVPVRLKSNQSLGTQISMRES